MIRALLIVAAFALLSCQPKDEPADTGLAGFDPDAVETGRAACEAEGGTFAKAGLAQALICVMPTRDAGKICTSGTQCEGLCLARSGTCAPVTPLFGCNDIITDNGGMATLCID